MKLKGILSALATILLSAALLAQESIVGIGVSLAPDTKTGQPKIMQVIPASPADKAGVKAGMILRKVGQVDVAGKKLGECVALIRGPIGSKVTLELLDPGLQTTTQLEITRDKIVVAAPIKAKRGDPAASLKISEWVKRGPVDVTDGKNVYVVEFWATWCGPCRTSIPHLTQLQKRFQEKGVVVVGVSDEDPGTVKPFVTKMGEQMDYAVACDDSRQTFAAYMQAYQHRGIPTAFVVDKKGKVVWDGHPLAGLDEAIESALAGTTAKN